MELSLDVTAYPYGGQVPMPAHPMTVDAEAPAGRSGPFDHARFAGLQHTLNPCGPVGAGDQGYMGRDVTDPGTPGVPEGLGMFARLHHEAREGR